MCRSECGWTRIVLGRREEAIVFIVLESAVERRKGCRSLFHSANLAVTSRHTALSVTVTTTAR